MELLGLSIVGLLLIAFLAIIVPASLIWLAVKAVGLLFRILGLGGGNPGRSHPASGARAEKGPGRLFAFLRGMVRDAVSIVGHALTAVLSVLLSLGNLVFLRFAASRELLRTAGAEVEALIVAAYRIALGHPFRLLGLGALLTGLERRIPDAFARASQQAGRVPATAVPRRGSLGEPAPLQGYIIQRELPPGGSGARLFVATLTGAKRQELKARGTAAPEQVVIKQFRLSGGSTLPQILRESRSLEPARRLGLVLDSFLDEESFQYVMPFVEGPSVDEWTRRLHHGNRPLPASDLQSVMTHAQRLALELERFHGEGLWHKDIKPANLILGKNGLEIVDLGLVTPLASALTLTTHGTEYYRDPEMVRLALRGVRVHEVNGVLFDIYGAGAVLFSMLEGAFPAQGSLSPFQKQSPEALRYIVRRAMADFSSRYPSAALMAGDLGFLLAATDPARVRPADLPSFGCETAGPLPAGPPARRPVALGGGEDGPVTADARSVGYEVRGTGPERRQRRSSLRRGVLIGAAGFLAAIGTAWSIRSFAARPAPTANDFGPGLGTPVADGSESSSPEELAYREAARRSVGGFSGDAPCPRSDHKLLVLPFGIDPPSIGVIAGLGLDPWSEVLTPDPILSAELVRLLHEADLAGRPISSKQVGLLLEEHLGAATLLVRTIAADGIPIWDPIDHSGHSR